MYILLLINYEIHIVKDLCQHIQGNIVCLKNKLDNSLTQIIPLLAITAECLHLINIEAE